MHFSKSLQCRRRIELIKELNANCATENGAREREILVCSDFILAEIKSQCSTRTEF